MSCNEQWLIITNSAKPSVMKSEYFVQIKDIFEEDFIK